MLSLIAIALAALPLYWSYSIYVSLQKNISVAKLSGLQYVITPVDVYNRAWLITHRLWIPLLRKLPSSLTGDWIDFINPDWCWNKLFNPFLKYGDTFITVSPARCVVWVSSPEAIQQITQKRDAFPKPLESYAVLDIYGRNVVTTEGMDWKKHRKVTAPGFNERNNGRVFKESIVQAQGMLRKWTGPEGKGNITLTEVPMDSMRLTLHIISRVGFGVGLSWPGEKPSDNERQTGIDFSSSEPPEGFTMTFEHALVSLLDNLIWVLIFPSWLLKKLPIASAKESYEAYKNWGQYMNTIHDRKVAEAKEGEHAEGMDIMGSLVKSTMAQQEAFDAKSSLGLAEKDQAGQPPLTISDILGNAFVMLIAGHETTANSVHFALMMLATSPGSQRRLQQEVETIFRDTLPENWDYDSSINACLGGMIGAVLNEQLRLMPPVINIPKSVRKDQDQTLVLDGKKVVLGKGSLINLNTVGVHRNPRYWPNRGQSKISGLSNDLDDFIPERWLINKDNVDSSKGSDTPEQGDSSDEDFGSFTGRDTAEQLFRPARGAFVPFSDGPRSCLGRRLAQVEVVVVFSVIFQQYSIELAVDEWATDDEVAKMAKEEKTDLYRKATAAAAETMRSANTRITLKLHDGKGYIPVRLVRKGEERFINLLE